MYIGAHTGHCVWDDNFKQRSLSLRNNDRFLRTLRRFSVCPFISVTCKDIEPSLTATHFSLLPRDYGPDGLKFQL